MNYYDMSKCLCKELCCEFEKFEHDPQEKYLHNVHKLIESMVGLTELEAAGAMREYLEDEHGYDSRSGQFKNRSWDMMPYGIYNAGKRYPMTGKDGMYPYPTYTGIPYGDGDEWEYNDRYLINRADGRDMRRDGEVYDRGRSRDSRGRYNDGRMGIYNMAHMDGMKHKDKLTDKEYQEWVDNMVGADGSRGGMWDKAQTTAVAKKIGIDFKDYDESAFWVAMNMIYSDTCEVMEKHGIDKPEVFAELAESWLSDDDTVKGAEKLALYYEFIVEK